MCPNIIVRYIFFSNVIQIIINIYIIPQPINQITNSQRFDNICCQKDVNKLRWSARMKCNKISTQKIKIGYMRIIIKINIINAIKKCGYIILKHK